MDRSVKVDWLNFTTKRSLADVLQLFSYLNSPLLPQEKGMYGYGHRFSSADGVDVLFDAIRPDIHIQMSGRACDCEHLKILDLVEAGDNVTRLDIAIDCMNSGFTCAEIWRLLCQRSFVSVSSNIRHIEGLVRDQGHTIYVGSPSSDRMVRIYDKAAEQGVTGDWLRFEIQLRRSSANQFFLEGCRSDDFVSKSFGLLSRQIRLVAEGQDVENAVKNGNTARLVLHDFWLALTDMVKPLVLKIFKPIKTVRNCIRYVKNAGAAIKTLRNVMPDFPEFFDSVVEDAQLKTHHRAIQDDYFSAGVSQADIYDTFLYSTQFQQCGG